MANINEMRVALLITVLIMLFISISAVNAMDNENATDSISDSIETDLSISNESILQSSEITVNSSSDLINEISNAENGTEILIEPGTYQINNIEITKNITFQGNGNPRDVIIDCEKKGSTFLIRSDAVHVTFKNMTFINADVIGFGGAISMETGHVYVDNCIFANNTASVNAGGISNYGSSKTKGYLLVNNSLFINNHGDHDGGAITTCYANSDIYNCIFINNSAHRDGGAIRVSVEGYGNVQDCIFMYNHADEWGGAYYSWSGTSNIERCVFLNNTAGTNGGAIMVSGDINVESCIIVNNSGGETGGAVYIQQPMYNARTVINFHNNLITNNTSPHGKEIYIKWNNTQHLFTKFNNNDWGDEDPNDSSVIDPDHVTSRSKVTSTQTSDLLDTLSMNPLLGYDDMIGDYFPEGYLDNIGQDGNGENDGPASNSTDDQHQKGSSDAKDNQNITHRKDSAQKSDNNAIKHKDATSKNNDDVISPNSNKPIIPNLNNQTITNSELNNSQSTDENNEIAIGNSTTVGKEYKAYELNKSSSTAKTVASNINYYLIASLIIAMILLIIGYKREKAKDK